MKSRSLLPIVLVSLVAGPAWSQMPGQDTRSTALAPDIRNDEAPLKIQDGDFVVVPIPISNPTLGTGLVVGAAYFYPQTEEQKKVEPPTALFNDQAFGKHCQYFL